MPSWAGGISLLTFLLCLLCNDQFNANTLSGRAMGNGSRINGDKFKR